jgi:hypothetical protein
MAVPETLLVEPGGEDRFFLPVAGSVPLEAHCPECGAVLRLGTLDPAITEGYSIPYVLCANNCDLRGYAF